jgi:hypothetical protein
MVIIPVFKPDFKVTDIRMASAGQETSGETLSGEDSFAGFFHSSRSS